MFWIVIAVIAAIAVIAFGTAVLRGWRPRPGTRPLDRLRRQDPRAADLIDEATTPDRTGPTASWAAYDPPPDRRPRRRAGVETKGPGRRPGPFGLRSSEPREVQLSP